MINENVCRGKFLVFGLECSGFTPKQAGCHQHSHFRSCLKCTSGSWIFPKLFSFCPQHPQVLNIIILSITQSFITNQMAIPQSLKSRLADEGHSSQEQLSLNVKISRFLSIFILIHLFIFSPWWRNTFCSSPLSPNFLLVTDRPVFLRKGHRFADWQLRVCSDLWWILSNKSASHLCNCTEGQTQRWLLSAHYLVTGSLLSVSFPIIAENLLSRLTFPEGSGLQSTYYIFMFLMSCSIS